ncbi:LamG domain-containing protein [Hazenella sp. IB182357]|uniref:LamG domain-containing protein n=1 Tax=Polycladospora coralii TaxID=2771432 RepID=A0A926NA62_9BACL|nr:LamG domain-containing protein [Polycladospora coralii]MBD1371435.1 LamG domain-containing protein [Polycladospora coralii]
MLKKVLSFILISSIVWAGLIGISTLERNSAAYQDGQKGLYAYYTRTEFNEHSKQISGDHADIIVNLDDKGQFVFSRKYSYRPTWVTSNQEEVVDHLASIKGDGPAEKNFDKRSTYSYARIIEQSNEQVVIHWRYFPDFNKLDPTGVVHEIYTIKRNGIVIREFKKGTEKVEDWDDPKNKIVQTFRLTAKGIRNIDKQESSYSAKAEPVKGNPVLSPSKESPVAWWKFDEGEGNQVTEVHSDRKTTIAGHTSLWKKGISGTALGFDGYYANINIQGQDTPQIKENFTIDTWVVLGAYPWDKAPIIHQSTHFGEEGYYLGFNEQGQITFTVNGQEIVTNNPVNRNQWLHIVGTYGEGSMEIYLNGVQEAKRSVFGEVDIPYEKPLRIGLNTEALSATAPVREEQNYPTLFGLEGLIDEVKIYNKKLSAATITSTFNRIKPGDAITKNPDIQKRILPGEPGAGAKFGATYKRLKYHDLWDNMWRVDPYSDVIVKFDKLPTNYVYWRGTSYGVNMVTENNLWMSDQSVELANANATPGKPSLAEHMSDKEARYSHVRVLENTDARVVIHWRYAVNDVFFNQAFETDFVDEYHTIYPDGTLFRSLEYWGFSDHMKEEDVDLLIEGDLQPLTPADKLPSDIINEQALSIANIDGTKKDLIYDGSQFKEDGEYLGEILMANFKSNWKIFTAFQAGGNGGPWGKEEQSPHSNNMFTGPWNHWPVARIVSDGRYAFDGDGRVNHFALSTSEGHSAFMYGFSNQFNKTKQDITDLISIVKAWRQSPELTNLQGGIDEDYDGEQRDYNLVMHEDSLSFTLNGSEENPIHNPAFEILNWNSDHKAELFMDTKRVRNFRQGIVRDTDGVQKLILYLPLDTQDKMNLEIRKVK